MAVMVALVIQVGRVAEFGDRIGAGILAWVFAVFLAGSIYGLSYWDGRAKYTITADPEDKRSFAAQTRVKRVSDDARKEARFWLVLFVIIDGGLNLSETMSALPTGVIGWQYVGAIVYGVFPTLAAFGLGRLQAYIERIPTVSAGGKSWLDRLVEWLEQGDPTSGQESKQAPQALPASSKLKAQADKLPPQEEQVAGASDKQGEQVTPAIARKSDKQADALQVQGDKQPVQATALLAYWSDNPKASDQQVADKFGVKRQAIQQRRTALIQSGDIRMTSNGIEIVGVPVQMQEVKS
jgi:hypothetical protein